MRFGQREVANVTFYNLATGEPDIYLDSLKLSSVGSDSQLNWITGGQGAPRLLAFENQRNVSFKAQDALATMESIAMLSGSAVTLGSGTAATMYKRETLVISATHTATLTKTPITPSATNFFVYVASSAIDTENGTQLAFDTDGTPASGSFSVSSTTVTCNADILEGTYITCFYTYSDTAATTKRLAFTSSTFGGYYKIVGDTLIQTESGVNKPFQLVIPKTKILSKWNYEFKGEGDAILFDFEFEAAKDLTSTELVYFVAQFA